MNRRFFALILTLCMALSLLSASAWAAETSAEAAEAFDQTHRVVTAEDGDDDFDGFDDFDDGWEDGEEDGDDDYNGDEGDDSVFDQFPNTIECKSSFTRTANAKKDQTFRLNASANDAPLSYQSSSKKNVWVDQDRVTVKKGFSGKVVITITSAETREYLPAEMKVTVTVNPSGTSLTSASLGKKAGTVSLAWKKNTTGKGYLIEYSTDKKFKKNVKTTTIGKSGTEKTTVKLKLKDLKPGTPVYFHIRTVNGKLSSGWSKTKSVKVK